MTSWLEQIKRQKQKQVQDLVCSKQIIDEKMKNQQINFQKGRFKLDITHSTMVDEQYCKRQTLKVQHNFLESLKDNNDEEIKNQIHKYAKQQTIMKDRKQLAKKYNIDLNQVMMEGSYKEKIPIQRKIQQQQPYSTVKPSHSWSIQQQNANFAKPTLFQTPLLPCIASEFQEREDHKNNDCSQSKEIHEKKGVWKIGTIKGKGNHALMTINHIEFEVDFIPAQGKIAAIQGNNYYELPDWQGIWVARPKIDLFSQ